MSGACQFCKHRTLVPYDEGGKKICSSCDRVQDFDDFQTYFGGISGETGTYVHIGSSGTGNIPTFKEKKVYEANNLIDDFVFRLNLSPEKLTEIKSLIHKITEGEYGMGNWFPVLIGACTYVVVRKDGKFILPIVQVADAVGCDVYELGSMVARVVSFVDMQLPVFDIVTALKHAVMNSTCFSGVSDDVRGTMVQQGVFLVQCLIKWCISTGRRPMPVVVAVMVFVAELNQVGVKIGEVAKEMNVAVSTCKRRYKELSEALVKVAGNVLPWGKDVTVKNIVSNAPFVIQYMELKSMKKRDGKRKGSGLEMVSCDIDGLVDDCLSRRVGYSYDSLSVEEEDRESQYFEVETTLSNLIEAYSDKSDLSAESLALVYSNYLDDISIVKANAEVGHKRKGRESFDLEDDRDWWKGKSDLSKKLLPDQITNKDVGWDNAPPSFHRGCTRVAQRRERIKAAKLRIQNIKQPANNTESGLTNEVYLLDSENSQKRKKKKLDIDSEDLVIETLLLHNVKEEEIEKGYYNALLDLHVFNGRGSE